MDAALLSRHACPTLVRPMQTGDGFLARLPPLIAPLSAKELAGIAAAAMRHGNGLVEISKRGNVQVRGLTEAGGPALAASLAEIGLDLAGGLPISVDALLQGADVRRALAFADRLGALLDASDLAARLAPKIALVLDFGTRFAPATLVADIRIAFRAERAHLGVGGDAASAIWLGSVAADESSEAAFALLQRLAELGPLARLAGSAAIEPTLIGSTLVGTPGFLPDGASPSRAAFFGREAALSTGDDGVARIAFPFGQLAAADLARLAEAAARAGILAIAPAPERMLLFSGSPAAARSIREAASRLGLVVEAEDPRRAVFACIGAAGCASGSLPTRTLAAALAAAAPTLLDGSFALHLSGCAKGCAHAEAAAITLAAIDKRLAIVLEGRARDMARGFVPAKDIVSRMRRLAAEVDGRRSTGESSAAVLARIDAREVAAILRGETPGGSMESGSGIDGREPTASA